MKSASTWRRGAVAAAIALPLALASAGAAFADDAGSSSTPTTGDDGYGASPGTSVNLAVHAPECDGNVPYLRYAVDVSKDPTATSVDLTWSSIDGTHSETQKGLPVSGKVIWLGAAEAGGQPTAWPGWVFNNGTWEEGGAYTWVRPTVNVTFTVHDKTPTTSSTGAASTRSASFSDGVYRVGTASSADAGLVLPADLTTGARVSYPPATTACANPLNAPSTPTSPGSTSNTPGSTNTTPGVPETTPANPPLASTGADIAPFAGAGVLLLAIGGVLVLVSRRHRKLPNQD